MINEPQKQPAIRLIEFEVADLKISNGILFAEKIPEEIEIDFKFKIHFFGEELGNILPKKHYTVNFLLHLLNKSKALEINLTAVALFESTNEIDENFKNSDFVNKNSPAIAYPYLRSFVSTLTSNAGIGNLVLPTMNFANISN